jgi:hypothetical protein
MLNLRLSVAAEWRLWSYLISLDPWGDRYIDIETITVMQECDCSKATFYRAIAKFQEIDLLPKWFDIKDYKNVEQKVRDRHQNWSQPRNG